MPQYCPECAAPIMDYEAEIDRLAELNSERKHAAHELKRFAVRIEEMPRETRYGVCGKMLCHACEAIYRAVDTKAYWVALHAAYLKDRNERLAESD